jgi:hypothetical protein
MAYSFTGISYSLIGLLVLLPWILLVWAIVWGVRRMIRRPAATTTAAQ